MVRKFKSRYLPTLRIAKRNLRMKVQTGIWFEALPAPGMPGCLGF